LAKNLSLCIIYMRGMRGNQEKNQRILITGGTSGLGLELVRRFLNSGLKVVATGRQRIEIPGFEDRFTLCNTDFSDLQMVSAEMRRICSSHSFDLIINNAGILSPPVYTETANNLEYTFQVNFLAHLLINELIIKGINDHRNVRIATVTSPVYRFASIGPGIEQGAGNYRPMRSYASSKLYLAMMSELLASRHKESAIQCFAFDPGTFSSGIYRMQNTWFRYMYNVAAPFMRSPARVAKTLEELMLKEETVSGSIYDRSKKQRSVPETDKFQKSYFIDRCYELIDPFLK